MRAMASGKEKAWVATTAHWGATFAESKRFTLLGVIELAFFSFMAFVQQVTR